MHGQKKTLSIFLVLGFSISSAVALMLLLLLVVVVIIVYLMHLSCGFDEALFSFFLFLSFAVIFGPEACLFFSPPQLVERAQEDGPNLPARDTSGTYNVGREVSNKPNKAMDSVDAGFPTARIMTAAARRKLVESSLLPESY